MHGDGKAMAVGGIVITVEPDNRKETEIFLAEFPELTVYGSDEKGNIIGRLRGMDSVAVKEVARKIQSMETVCNVSLAYLVHEDDDVTER